MSYLGLILLLFASWTLTLVASARRNVVVARRTGHPPGGVSIFPGLPVMPLGFLFIAWLLEQLSPGVGLILVGGLHLGIGALCLASIAVSEISLRSAP